jgi:hypothetical protein
MEPITQQIVMAVEATGWSAGTTSGAVRVSTLFGYGVSWLVEAWEEDDNGYELRRGTRTLGVDDVAAVLAVCHNGVDQTTLARCGPWVGSRLYSLDPPGDQPREFVWFYPVREDGYVFRAERDALERCLEAELRAAFLGLDLVSSGVRDVLRAAVGTLLTRLPALSRPSRPPPPRPARSRRARHPGGRRRD